MDRSARASGMDKFMLDLDQHDGRVNPANPLHPQHGYYICLHARNDNVDCKLKAWEVQLYLPR